MRAFELRDVYMPHGPSPVARLELVTTQYAHSLIDALKGTLLAGPMEDRSAHFIVSGMAPIRNKQLDYAPTVDRQFYRWGLDCHMV
jgi:hypothetical protein